MKQVASDCPGVEVRDVNVIDNMERTASFGVFQTPFIVIDGVLAFDGLPPEEALRARIGRQPR